MRITTRLDWTRMRNSLDHMAQASRFDAAISRRNQEREAHARTDARDQRSIEQRNLVRALRDQRSMEQRNLVRASRQTEASATSYVPFAQQITADKHSERAATPEPLAHAGTANSEPTREHGMAADAAELQHTAGAAFDIKRAAQGDAWAQINLARRHVRGVGVPQDQAKALVLFTQAAAQGDAIAQESLGKYYLTGNGVERDEVKAARLFRKAAKQGLAAGQHQLGRCFEQGAGVVQDEEEAVKLYAQAASQGFAAAQHALGICYADGIGVARDLEAAVRLYAQAAGQGCASGQLSLGICYMEHRRRARPRRCRAQPPPSRRPGQGHGAVLVRLPDRVRSGREARHGRGCAPVPRCRGEVRRWGAGEAGRLSREG
jgi:TPR repeat protein